MPPRRRNTAADSTARFLSLRQRPAPRRPAVQQDQVEPRVVAQHGQLVPEEWRYVEDKFPGAYAAWRAGPDAPGTDFVLGVTGRPYYAVAIGRGNYSKEPKGRSCARAEEHSERRCFWLVDGRWELRPDPR